MIRGTCVLPAEGGGGMEVLFMSLRRYFGSDVWRRLCVMVMTLYRMRCSTLSHWRDLSTEAMGKCLKVMARANHFEYVEGVSFE